MSHPFQTTDWSALRVGVLGLGRSGAGAVGLLSQRGAWVRGFDDRVRAGAGLPLHELRLADEITPPADLDDLDALVVSPGIDPAHYLLIAARRQALPVVGEIELAAQRFTGPVVGITGTNGKSTVASLLHHCLVQAGGPTVLGGNIGVAASEVARQAQPDTVAVLELSSFQLETIDTFRPHVAVLLNIAPDHLDRYPTFESYAAAKRNLLRNLTTEDWFVGYAQDEHAQAWAAQTRAQVLWFDDRPLPPDVEGVFSDGDTFVGRWGGRDQVLAPQAGIQLLGRHNQQNIAAVLACGIALGIDANAMAAALPTFASLPHRTEPVAEVDGVRYVNDSKATNVHATQASLAGLGGSLVLLLGGSGKGEDYGPLRDQLGSVRTVICYGAEGPNIAAALAGAGDIQQTTALAAAVSLAAEVAHSGDTVLLSPACASFDEFENFAARGVAFREFVLALSEGGK